MSQELPCSSHSLCRILSISCFLGYILCDGIYSYQIHEGMEIQSIRDTTQDKWYPQHKNVEEAKFWSHLNGWEERKPLDRRTKTMEHHLLFTTLGGMREGGNIAPSLKDEHKELQNQRMISPFQEIILLPPSLSWLPTWLQGLTKYMPWIFLPIEFHHWYEIQTIVKHLHETYMYYSQNYQKIPASIELEQLCQSIFDHEDIHIIYQHAMMDMDWTTRIQYNYELCASSFPYPMLWLEKNRLILRISKQWSYHEIMNVFEWLLHELENEEIDSHTYLTTQIKKLQEISMYIHRITYAFQTQEYIIYRIRHTAAQIEQYYRYFLSMKDIMIEPRQYKILQEKIATSKTIRYLTELQTMEYQLSSKTNVNWFVSSWIGNIHGIFNVFGDIVESMTNHILGRPIQTFCIQCTSCIISICCSFYLIRCLWWGCCIYRKYSLVDHQHSISYTPRISCSSFHHPSTETILKKNKKSPRKYYS
jgi:hypothetical protein